MPIDWTQVAISGAVGGAVAGVAGLVKQRRRGRATEDHPIEPGAVPPTEREDDADGR